jgi:hypothetical protein
MGVGALACINAITLSTVSQCYAHLSLEFNIFPIAFIHLHPCLQFSLAICHCHLWGSSYLYDLGAQQGVGHIDSGLPLFLPR